MKQTILNHIKNIYGWKTKRKIVVISVDDYGNVRLDSKKARDKLDVSGFEAIAPTFDRFDTLETKIDLEMLFDTLSSVKDVDGRSAVLTPFAIPCNINFEKMALNNYEKYEYEILPETYVKLSDKNPNAYKGAWELWKEGITNGLLRPQFHGREHFNLSFFNEKLQKKDRRLIANLENRSNTSLMKLENRNIKYSAAFQYDKLIETEKFPVIIKTGLDAFEKVFGCRAVHFNAPGGTESLTLHKYLKESGVNFLDAPLIKKELMGDGQFKKSIYYTGKKNYLGMTYLVRNVVFEPLDNSSAVEMALNQIETAFFWNRPAIISSHRVNFCGHIDPKNRETGILALKELLQKIVQKWPDVEFMSSEALGDLMLANKS